MMAAAVGTVMTLGELLGGVPANFSGIGLSDLVMDSRQAGPGAAFVAVQGEESHGLDYVDDAVSRGATVVLYEPARGIGIRTGDVPALAVEGLRGRIGELGRRFFAPEGPAPRLAGITGTNGKSTVAYLVAQAQTLRGVPCGYSGTVGAGVPPDLEPQSLTTPDCFSVHRTLKSLGTPYAVLEISSHALAQDRVAGLAVDTAVFTNLTRDHLDYHGSMERYRSAKARLFQWPGLRRAVIFVDDSHGRSLAGEIANSVERVEVGLKDRGHLRGRVLGASLAGTSLQVDVTPSADSRERAGGSVSATSAERESEAAVSPDRAVIDSSLAGDFNAENLLLALGVLLGWDVPLNEACEALGRCQAPPGRLQVLGGTARQPRVVVDFAHTPDSLERVLHNLRRLTGGELWCIFGCGGERDRGKRPLMGKAAASLAHHVVLTDDNPRGEDPAAIVADIRAGMIGHPDVRIEHDRATAIVETVSRASAGDVVLVAGKGHEARQLTAGRVREFSDAAVVRDALGGSA